jgi:hypothetical protein
MPSLGTDPEKTVEVTRVLRRQGYVVDLGEPLIEVEIEPYARLTIGTWREGGIYEMKAYPGQRMKAGETIAVIGVGGEYCDTVFIAYRRVDSSGYTGRIYDGLARDLGPRQVFRDVGSLTPGLDLREQVAAALQRTIVMVVIIGPSWLEAKDHNGQPRLFDAADLHRLEIRTALERGIRVLPVLVGRAPMPRPDQLPEDIRSLAYPLAIEVSDDRWDYDSQRVSNIVVEFLDDHRYRKEMQAWQESDSDLR